MLWGTPFACALFPEAFARQDERLSLLETTCTALAGAGAFAAEAVVGFLPAMRLRLGDTVAEWREWVGK